jgi:microcystin degradation protein MlrC
VRLAALGFYHESNTFVVEPTTVDRFEETAWVRGDEILQVEGDSHSSMAGFLAIGQVSGVDVVPLLWVRATPSGTIAGATFDRIADELVAVLDERGPWDGVLLVLHGAAVSERYLDADGEIAERVRATVGDHVPIGLALDMHGNVSSRLVGSATVTTMYRTNPHVDARARALECAEIVVRTVRGEVRPVQALVQVPAVINILRQFTGEDPMSAILDDLEAVLATPGMLSASVAEGYPYADVAEMGMAVLTVHDGSAETAAVEARKLAARIWARRGEFLASAMPVDEAIREAGVSEGPVLLLDVGDNIGGGAPGDSNVLLEAAIRLGAHGVLAILFDPEAVRACAQAGVGTTLTLPVGGKRGPLRDRRVEVTGQVRLVADGRFEEATPTHGGFRHFDPGITAVLDTTDGHTVVLISKLIPPLSIRQLTTLGIDPSSFAMIVAKGVQSPRPAYEPIAKRLIMVDTPGVTAASLSDFAYRSRRKPLHPFEEVPDYRPEALVFGTP